MLHDPDHREVAGVLLLDDTMDTAEVKDAIIREMTKAMANLGAKSDLLGIACSYGDTLDDTDVLSMLREWNSYGPVNSA